MKSHRPERLASVIQVVVSETIAQDLHDPRIGPFVSVTKVTVSSDLLVARVFISVMGDEAVQRTTMRGLQHARGRIRHAVAQAVTVRQCPEIVFELDDSLKKTAEILRIIAENVPPPTPTDDADGGPADPPADDADGGAADPSEDETHGETG